jgi:hypothetical protein
MRYIARRPLRGRPNVAALSNSDLITKDGGKVGISGSMEEIVVLLPEYLQGRARHASPSFHNKRP